MYETNAVLYAPLPDNQFVAAIQRLPTSCNANEGLQTDECECKNLEFYGNRDEIGFFFFYFFCVIKSVLENE